MLTPYLKSQFVEKILTDRHGRQFRCLFLVALVDGEVKGRLISAELLKPTSYQLQATSSKLYLPILKKKPVISQFEFLLPITSSFVPKDFSFVTSQMTRAPSRL